MQFSATLIATAAAVSPLPSSFLSSLSLFSFTFSISLFSLRFLFRFPSFLSISFTRERSCFQSKNSSHDRNSFISIFTVKIDIEVSSKSNSYVFHSLFYTKVRRTYLLRFCFPCFFLFCFFYLTFALFRLANFIFNMRILSALIHFYNLLYGRYVDQFENLML